MTPQETLRRALLNDEFPEDVAADRLFTPSGEDALRLNRNIALSAWMSQVSGQDINAGSPTWQQHKDALVQGYFKNPTASNVSDEQLHSIVKTHIQTAEEAADIAANIALQGKPSSEALKMLNAKRGPSLVRGVWDGYTNDALNRHFALASKLSPYRGIIDSAASQLGSEMEWSVPTTQKFQEVAKTLLEVPEADRLLVISAIGATGGVTPEERASYLAKLAGAMGRMTETMGASTVGTLEQIGTTFEQLGQVPEAIASALSGGVTMQGELAASKSRSEEMLKAKEDQVAFQILTQQIRQVADSEVSPIKGGGWWSQTGIDVARMIPQVAVTVANPTLGTAANLAYFRNTVAAEAKSEDPSLTYEQADAIGGLTAPFNATIETATALIPFGRVKVPLLTKWLSTATTSLRGTARNIALRSAAGAVSEVGEEMAQAIAPLWTQEALSALQKDMPSVDWERRMPDFSKIAAQTWGPALAFGLVAGGAASISEVSSGRLLTSDRDKLIELGVSPIKADEIAAASVAGDWAKTDALIREDGIFTTATPEEMKEAAAANRDEENRHVAIEEELKRRGELPDVMINPQTGKYRVIDRDGNVLVETDKRADALNVAYSTLEENQRIAAEATVKIFDELMATRGTQSEGAIVSQRRQTAQTLVDEGIVSYDQMMQGAMTAAKADGVSEQQSQVDSSTINGFSRAEYWDQVRTMVSRTFATGGVETAIHETVHARVRRGMANGTYTREMALEWVRAAERALEGKTDKAGKPIKFLPSENDADIDDRVLEEAVAELAVADVIGRRKSGDRFTPGLIAEGISAKLRAEKNAFLGKTKEERVAARKGGNLARFKLFLQGWKETLGNMLRIARQVQAARQEGKLGEDFDAFLDNLLGTDAQSRYDLQTQQEAKEILEEGNMPFSMSRAKPVDTSNVTELPDGAQLVGPTMFSITAYHGTPHKVDKFTTAKIGTGEGAQAYGWGLYFAEDRGIGEYYQRALTDNTLYFKGDPLLKNGVMVGSLGDAELDDWFYHGSESYDPEESAQSAEADGRPDIAAKIRALIPDITKGEPGNLYTVELLPDADEFLDWDKPLSEQSEKVKAAIRKLLNIPEVTVDQRNDTLNGNPWVARFSGSNVAIHPDKETAIRLGNDEALNLYARSGSEAYRAINPDDEAASDTLAKAGIPGIRYLDGGSRGAGDGTRNYVIFDESLVKILEENGKPVESPMFSMTPQDREYLAAVESGDMAKAQAMVDEAAKAAGYNVGPVWHGTLASFSEFAKEKLGEYTGAASAKMGFFFGSSKENSVSYTKDVWASLVKNDAAVIAANAEYGRLKDEAEKASDAQYKSQFNASLNPSERKAFIEKMNAAKTAASKAAGAIQTTMEKRRSEMAKVLPFYLKAKNIYEVDFKGSPWRPQTFASVIQEGIENGSDGVHIKNTKDPLPTDVFVVFDPNNIKSADLVTRDESGQVIPLSQRFNPETPDIRFSSRSMASVLEVALEAQRRNPEFRERLLRLAVEKAQAIRQDGPMRVNKRGIVSQRKGTDTMADNDRTKANIEAERKFRLRSRQRELIDAGMAQLTPETLAAYDQGLTTLEDNPLISSMLNDHGKLMSKTAAQKAGKLKTDGKGNAGDYDDAPRLPIAWYSKSGGIMPDVMAENLGFDSVPAFWEALRSAIYSTRTTNESFKKARAAVRQIEVDALAQATKEANEWAAEAESKVPTPKEKQLAALRTLDAILSIFPPEISGKIGGMYQVAKANTDAAREKEILKRVEIIDKVLEKEGVKIYRAKIEKLFKRYAPKAEAGKKPVGQLEPDAQELVDAASEAMSYDEVRMRAEVSAIDSMLAEEGLSDERETYLERKRELIQLFADYKNADAARLESAADALEATASEGWAKWKLKKIMDRERREETRKSLVADTGKPSIGKERDKQNKWAKTTFGKPFSMLLNISSFSELLRFEFGEKSAEARRLEDQERAAAYAYEDAMQAFGDRVGDFFAELAGGRLAGEQLRFDLAQPTLTVGTGDNERTISQLQGIQALLMWQQEDGRRHMEGQLDESGKPVGSWHYGEDWVKDLESKMTPEAYQVKAFLEQLYSEEYPALNALYRQRHGVNLPKNPLYSPLTVQPMQAKAGEMVDPVSGFAVTGSILTPGGLRTRNKRAVAEPRFEDAVQIFLGHSRQMEHWKAYYDFAMDAQAILLNRDVTNAVESKGSKEAVAVLKKWVDQFAQGGSRDAQAGLEISNFYSRISGRAARVALLGRISTLLIQSTQLAAASVKMPVGAYLKRLGMLLSGNLNYADAVKSPFIQRRYKTAPPIVQQANAGVGDANRPGALSSTTPRILGNALSGADALFTGGTYAMILDYHRTVTGPALGLQGAELESFARKEAERDTEAVAQPVRAGARSIFENTLTSPLAKTGFAFASEARQKIALAAWSAYKSKSDPTQAAKVAFLTFVVGGLVTQVIKNLWREAKGDDDEKMWSAERLTKATLAGPLHGIPGVSELMGDPGLFSGFKWSAGAVEKIATKAMEDDLDEVTMRDMENALSAAGYFNDTAAGIAGLSHLGFDFAKILQALAEEE